MSAHYLHFLPTPEEKASLAERFDLVNAGDRVALRLRARGWPAVVTVDLESVRLHEGSATIGLAVVFRVARNDRSEAGTVNVLVTRHTIEVAIRDALNSVLDAILARLDFAKKFAAADRSAT